MDRCLLVGGGRGGEAGGSRAGSGGKKGTKMRGIVGLAVCEGRPLGFCVSCMGFDMREKKEGGEGKKKGARRKGGKSKEFFHDVYFGFPAPGVIDSIPCELFQDCKSVLISRRQSGCVISLSRYLVISSFFGMVVG